MPVDNSQDDNQEPGPLLKAKRTTKRKYHFKDDVIYNTEVSKDVLKVVVVILPKTNLDTLEIRKRSKFVQGLTLIGKSSI